jgi:riboflavin-specific deaminase-like protein
VRPVDDRTEAIPIREGGDESLSDAFAWALLLGLRARIASQGVLTRPVGLRLDDGATLREVDESEAWIIADPDHPRGWALPGARRELVPELARTTQLLDLYMPLLVSARADVLAVAHLAQSLDGRVATTDGVSQFISDMPDLVHTHRMRALFDGVLVGACTVELDDPQLTTRHVTGDNPVRVVLDPQSRLRADYRVFSDGEARTLLLRGPGSPPVASTQTEVVELPIDGGVFEIRAVIAVLAARGVRRLFVEGGGVTVSHFVQARALDRIHVTVAPMIIGSGRPSFTLPVVASLDDALRLQCRHHALGPDVLFDCTL